MAKLTKQERLEIHIQKSKECKMRLVHQGKWEDKLQKRREDKLQKHVLRSIDDTPSQVPDIDRADVLEQRAREIRAELEEATLTALSYQRRACSEYTPSLRQTNNIGYVHLCRNCNLGRKRHDIADT